MKKLIMLFLSLIVLMLVMLPVLAESGETPVIPYIDLTPIFQAIIALLSGLITYKLIPWIKARTTAQQQDMLRAATSVAVYAAEQIYGAGHGKDKLLYVKGRLADKGFDIDIDEIEAAVRDLTLAEEAGGMLLEGTLETTE
ncbi:MAG: holin [Clostridiales bacterium]|nr:holin [Clostridiales bacterium]